MTLLLTIRKSIVFCLFVAIATPLQAEPLQAEPPLQAKPLQEDEEHGFEPLLGANAKELWRGYATEGWPAGWELEEGVLARVAGGGDIMTIENFSDFELRLEWKISSRSNSGIIYRVSTGDKASYHSGMEFQVLDDAPHQQQKGDKSTFAGSLYGLYARSEAVALPVGEWNDAKILIQGNHIEHWLNGKKVVECEMGSDDWNERLAKSKFATWPKFAKNREGHIALQDHDRPVWYRNVRIKRLSETK